LRTVFSYYLSGRRRAWLLGLAALLLSACEQPTVVDRIRADGELIVATRVHPLVYSPGDEETSGLEYELLRRFAEQLGVELRLVVAPSIGGLLDDVRSGRVHMGSAGLSVTPQRKGSLRFSRPYLSIRTQLVYRRSERRPRSLADLGRGRLIVLAGSSHEELLDRQKRRRYSQLDWLSITGSDTRVLLQMVAEGDFDYTLADSNELSLARKDLPELRPAFSIGRHDQIAWAFPRFGGAGLVKAANRFLRQQQDTGALAELIDRYYADAFTPESIAERDFLQHIGERLPRYELLFRRAGEETGLDWRLLAAVGYQESHWNPRAVSPTGVRGIMMLTQAAAKDLGIKDRIDPKQSIFGGARYLSAMIEKIPARIPEPERLYFALAGYNVGFGHLEDARILTQRQGGNPDSWEEVRERLPLLRQKKYYATLKRGFARGNEPVTYVENIRRYYELLVWHSNDRLHRTPVPPVADALEFHSAIDSRSIDK
jgi:membrane-bound lytic murein transglycosylase F